MIDIFERLFGGFEGARLHYSIFKGLEHLDEDLLGMRGDVDVWVAESDLGAAVSVARDAGFFPVSWSSPRMAAFIMVGWDVATGRKVFVHVHHAPIALRKRSLAPLVFVYRSLPSAIEPETRPAIAAERWRTTFEANRAAIGAVKTLGRVRLALAGRATLRTLDFRFSLIETARTVLSYLHRFGALRGRFRIGRGMLIAFTGIDGSGKSSVVDNFRKSDFLKSTQGVRVSYFGNNAFWMPGLSRAFVTYRRGSALTPVVMGLAVLDRKLRIIPALIARSRGNVVLCDRYFYDQNIGDPTRNFFRNRFVKAIANPFVSWIPVQPDLSFYLRIDPRAAFQRKPEGEFEKLEQIAHAYDEYFTGRDGITVVDAGADLDSVLASVRSSIIDHYRGRAGSEAAIA